MSVVEMAVQLSFKRLPTRHFARDRIHRAILAVLSEARELSLDC